MALNLVHLDDDKRTRRLMLEELEYDIGRSNDLTP